MNIGKVIKSLSDKRVYHPIVLKNNLECLLISDKDAQKSAAALSVGVGSLSDPVDAQGLAHYLEHMLFMGTKKYPEENEYSSYLAKNSGSSNAYTSQQETNFFFEVSHGAFKQSLDMFSHFFIDPLMLDSSSEKQLNAVHSEHSKNLQSDPWRKFQLSKAIAKKDHPYSKFSTGDKSSLSNPNLRQMLFKFYDDNYSSNLMKLVIYGQMDIDAMVRQVTDRFEHVPNKEYKGFRMQEQPFGQNALGKLVKLVPVKEKHTLDLSWVIRNKQEYYEYPPSKYIGHIIGHEGKGSLLSFLVDEGLATSISAGGSDNYSCYSQFEMTVTLTDKGITQIRQIVSHILYFIELLKKKGPQQWVVEELKKVNKMKFDFMAKKQGMNYCSSIAKNLHKKKMQQILAYPYFMKEYKPQVIQSYLDQLQLDNLIVFAESQTFEKQCDKKEAIYGTKYCIEELGKLQPAPCSVDLPQANEFIPENLEVLPMGTEVFPKLCAKTNSLEAYYKADHLFELPKAELNLRFYFDGQFSVHNEIARSLFSKMLNQKLRQFAYQAQMAELFSEVNFSSYYTFNLHVTGFRDSYHKFLSKYLQQIMDFIPQNQKLFEVLKEKTTKQYKNYFLNNPYQLAYNSITSALREGGMAPPQEKVECIAKMKLQDIQHFAKQWKKRIFSEIYIAGNLSEPQAHNIIELIQQVVKSKSQELPKCSVGSIRPVFLPVNQTSVVEETLSSKQETNSSIIVHYQYEAQKVRTKILQELALSFIKEPAFDYLRTKEQLGYIVMCLPDDNRGVLGFSILVQSNTKTSHELRDYVSNFVHNIMKEKIDKFDEKEFEEYKQALLSTKKQQDKNLASETNRFWSEVVKHAYQFNRKQQEIELIPTITLAEIKSFMNNLFYQAPRVFEIHQVEQTNKPKNDEVIKKRLQSEGLTKLYSSVESFRKNMSLYPDFYSHL